MIQNPAFLEGSEGGMKRRNAGNRTSRAALPLAGVVTIGLGLFGGLQGPSEGSVLHASSHTVYDYDLDGLSNHFEQVLDCSQYTSDSDGDGFSDLEEFARGSDPSDAAEQPLPGNLSIQVSASGEESGVRIQIATYYRDGQASNKELQVGMVVGGVVRMLPKFLEQPGVLVTRWNDPGMTGEILHISAPFPESLVHSFGQVSVFALLSVDPAPEFVGAAAVDLVSIDGVVGIIQDSDTERGVSVPSVSSATAGGAGSIYKPIPTGDGSVPSTWNPGEVCYQATIEVGIVGGTVTREVIAAGCVTGGGSCPSDCSQSVGDTFDTFDPMGLIGL